MFWGCVFSAIDSVLFCVYLLNLLFMKDSFDSFDFLEICAGIALICVSFLAAAVAFIIIHSEILK